MSKPVDAPPLLLGVLRGPTRAAESNDVSLRAVGDVTALLCRLPLVLTDSEQLLLRSLVTKVVAASQVADGSETAQVLGIIACRYSDSRLTLSAIAQELQLSVCHLSRLVTLRSGVGFLQHLHRTRVTAALHLLVSTRLSIKEIAAAVGYGSTSALDRQFKRAHHMTPLTFRRSRLTTKSAYPSQSMTTLLS